MPRPVSSPSTKAAIRVINRANFGRFTTSRYVACAAAVLKIGVARGETPAVYWLGMLQWDGWGVPKDREQALDLLRAAATGGSLRATYNLAVAYDNGYDVAQSHYTAFRYYREAAGMGCVDSMCALGSFYLWGQGVERDERKARRWYRKSAALGNANAMCDLARCYQRGAGGAKSPRWAIHWFNKAITAGCLRAYTGLGLAYACPPHEDWDRARYCLETAAEAGQSQAMYLLGVWAESGWSGAENPADALFWYSQAAALGHEKAALEEAILRGETF